MLYPLCLTARDLAVIVEIHQLMRGVNLSSLDPIRIFRDQVPLVEQLLSSIETLSLLLCSRPHYLRPECTETLGQDQDQVKTKTKTNTIKITFHNHDRVELLNSILSLIQFSFEYI